MAACGAVPGAAWDGLQTAIDALDRAAAALATPTDADLWRHRNLVTIARLIARAALRREESRGGHFREDFPNRDDIHWKVHLVETREPLNGSTTEVTETGGGHGL